MKDYYSILGVDKKATAEEISRAYRKLALQYHPDRNRDADAVKKFKDVAEAFEILGNPEKRAQYDNPVSQSWGSFSGSPFDIFNSFFGGGFGGANGVDIEMPVELEFTEAALGCSKEIKINVREICPNCQGSGAKTWQTCSACNGTGKRIVNQSPFIMQTMCQRCKGNGRIPEQNCNCHGGYSGSKEESLGVEIPAGVFPHMRIRIAGKGEADVNGVRGNLYLVIQVKKHPLFTRREMDVLCEVPVPYSVMVLGGTIEVPTLKGNAQVKIKPGTPDSKKMRLSGLGIPHINDPNVVGDMLLLLRTDVPTELNGEYKKIIETLSQMEKKNISPTIKQFNQYLV